MTQKKKRIPLLMLSMLLLFVMGVMFIEHESAASSSSIVQMADPLSEQEDNGAHTDVEEKTETKVETEAVEEESAALAAPPSPWLHYENVCESFTVIEGTKLVKTKHGKDYPVRYRRNRYKRKKSDQQRTRDLVKMVVKEMGGDKDAQRIVSMIAMHESSWNPEAIHILNPDLDANQVAWQRHTYSESTEYTIETKMKAASQKTNKDGYYGLKARLADIQLYKGNPHWDVKLRYDRVIPERTYGEEVYPKSSYEESRSVWAFGYGLYGMNAVLFTHLWDREAPPWILCGDDGIMATVVAVWALRKAQDSCEFLSKDNPERWGTEGGSAYGIVRRFARGKCSDKRLGPAWRRLMKDLDGIDWNGKPDFGTKFTRYEKYKRNKKWRFRKDENGKKIRTDRVAILEHMRTKAEEKGLLRTEPLERKKKNSAPRVVAKNESVAVGAL